MSQQITGGPAFPVPNLQDDPEFNGMSLRDYFAAKALQGLLAEPYTGGESTSHWLTSDFTSDASTKRGDRVAAAAYRLADAMLKARQT